MGLKRRRKLFEAVGSDSCFLRVNLVRLIETLWTSSPEVIQDVLSNLSLCNSEHHIYHKKQKYA